ncbi:uncharacterized protein SPPG_06954 [Spizellomyces punctatus DAOM BR117]|uniref:Ankyrin repeat domain-containing protein n=1 Tax=Spizellomyces punctatus (strain DAOM BR117) TaxID=645134 RepID=A0A0L0HAD0_SPIPD|nr:uncharacterized protein SPPG_06954 [Spizellomyces punctatus DAOM BR117]KNC97966.1 hypothetical protein SPPG_06954 [Spizellomyces punctatus DAOM BR117]|eukprot:XP_016606006.1 hypothetical protein SPPG_06954 [Spizellomyces punctatus DAOM BR117]
MSGNPDKYHLHRLIFKNETEALRTYLSSYPSTTPCPLFTETCRGQTPLTLAISLGRKECVKILLDAGASTLFKNMDGWTPFQEATSYGDREVMEWVYRTRRRELAFWFKSKGGELLRALSKDLKDFYLEMHWSFKSIIPFVSSICPSDTYKVFKKGKSIRIDTTLVGFESLSWVRGDISIIFTEEKDGPQLVICDHQRRVVQLVWPRDFSIGAKEVEEEISISLNTKMVAAPEFDFSSFSLSRTQSGFWTFKVDRNERVGPWETHVWSVDALECVNKTRTEHLKANPLPPTKEDNPLPEGEEEEEEDEDEKIRKYEAGEWNEPEELAKAKKAFRELARFRPTLDPPPTPEVTYEQFFSQGQEKEYLHVGRPQILEKTSRNYKATLWMYEGGEETPMAEGAEKEIIEKDTAAAAAYSSFPTIVQATPTPPPSLQSDEFPIKVETLFPLLELIGMGTNEHIRSLKEFFGVQLPPGFPVQIEIPIGLLPLSAVITFQNISTTYPIDQSMFAIPGKKEGYRMGEVVKGSDRH